MTDPRTEDALRASFQRAAGDIPGAPPDVRTLTDRRAGRRRHQAFAGGAAVALAAVLLVTVPNALRSSDTNVKAAGPDRNAPSGGTDDVFRPVVNLPGCKTTEAREDTILGAGEPMSTATSTQVLYLPDRPPPQGPLITLFLFRGKAPNGPIASGTLSVDAPAPGRQGGANWDFSDGSSAVAYARNISEDELINLLKSLQPSTDPSAGFSFVPRPQAQAYVLASVDSTVPSGTVASSRCERSARPPVVITAVTGKAPAVYAVLNGETAAAAATALHGATMLFADSSDPAAAQAALTHVDNAPLAKWAQYAKPSAPPSQGPSSTATPTTATRSDP